MSEPRRTDPAAAGALLVASVLLCGGLGLGLGELAGVPVPIGVVGLFVGLVVGFLLVRSRFRDI